MNAISRLVFGIIILSVLGITPSYAQKDRPKTIRLPDELPEVSGAYFIARDSLWWHNDGGHAPALICTNLKGEQIDKISLPELRNTDWEDLTADDQGHVYIGDFGNNRNTRQDLKIYIYRWSDGQVDSITFRYAEQKAFPPAIEDQGFDMEAFFYHNDTLHLFSKHKVKYTNYLTRHYQLPAQPGDYTLRAVDSLIIKKRVITGAAISPDGKTVVMSGYNYGRFLGIFPWVRNNVFLFTEFEGSKFLKGRMRKRKAPGCIFPKQYEAIDFFDNKTLYIATESIMFFKQKAKRMKLRK